MATPTRVTPALSAAAPAKTVSAPPVYSPASAGVTTETVGAVVSGSPPG